MPYSGHISSSLCWFSYLVLKGWVRRHYSSHARLGDIDQVADVLVVVDTSVNGLRTGPPLADTRRPMMHHEEWHRAALMLRHSAYARQASCAPMLLCCGVRACFIIPGARILMSVLFSMTSQIVTEYLLAVQDAESKEPGVSEATILWVFFTVKFYSMVLFVTLKRRNNSSNHENPLFYGLWSSNNTGQCGPHTGHLLFKVSCFQVFFERAGS